MRYVTAVVESGPYSFQFSDRAEMFGAWLARITADNWAVSHLATIRHYSEWDNPSNEGS